MEAALLDNNYPVYLLRVPDGEMKRRRYLLWVFDFITDH